MSSKRQYQSNRIALQHGPRKKQKRPQFEMSGANAMPIKSRPERTNSVDQSFDLINTEEQQKISRDQNIPDDDAPASRNDGVLLAEHFARAMQKSDVHPNLDLLNHLPLPPPPPILTSEPEPQIITRLSGSPTGASRILVDSIEQTLDENLTDGLGKSQPLSTSIAQEMMNANGTHSIHRHQQPPHTHLKDKASIKNDVAPFHTGLPGLMHSHIQVAKPFVFQQAIEGCLHDLGVALPREDNIRLAGVQWIDNVRRALKLPVRTFDTAVVYYHKFRLSHADNEYSFVDAAAAALFAACKIEDTLKKSRDILCAAYNLKIASRADHLSSDDSTFEYPSKTCIGLERLMLEASSFDFRNRHPQHLLVKLLRHYSYEKHSAISKTALSLCLDMYRTFAPLKQSTAAMAFACIELAGRLHGQVKKEIAEGQDYRRWSIERSMVIETLLDLLDLYTNYQKHTSVGAEFPLEAFLEIQIPLNEEVNAKKLPRYTEYLTPDQINSRTDPAGYAIATTNGITPKAPGPNGLHNGRLKTSPTSPATPITPGTPGIRQKAGERGKEGTVRFMLNPDQERDEKKTIKLYQPLLASMRR